LGNAISAVIGNNNNNKGKERADDLERETNYDSYDTE